MLIKQLKKIDTLLRRSIPRGINELYVANLQ